VTKIPVVDIAVPLNVRSQSKSKPPGNHLDTCCGLYSIHSLIAIHCSYTIQSVIAQSFDSVHYSSNDSCRHDALKSVAES